MTATTGADVIDITNKDIWDDTELVEAYNSAIQQYLTEHHPNQKKTTPTSVVHHIDAQNDEKTQSRDSSGSTKKNKGSTPLTTSSAGNAAKVHRNTSRNSKASSHSTTHLQVEMPRVQDSSVQNNGNTQTPTDKPNQHNNHQQYNQPQTQQSQYRHPDYYYNPYPPQSNYYQQYPNYEEESSSEETSDSEDDAPQQYGPSPHQFATPQQPHMAFPQPPQPHQYGSVQQPQMNYPYPPFYRPPTRDDALSNLLLSWYYSGYYAGQYQALQSRNQYGNRPY